MAADPRLRGIGVLIRSDLFVECNVDRCFEYADNILGIEINNKLTGNSMEVYCVYLPPENSRYAQQNEMILNLLIIDMYKHWDKSCVVICGDFNAWVESKSELSDDLPGRQVLDETENSQGNLFMSFVNDIKGFSVNGRITPELNDYTSSTGYRGSSVVDYCVMRECDMDCVKSMEVQSCIELIAKHDWQYLLTDECHAPDHNQLSISLELSMMLREKVVDLNLGAVNYKNKKVFRKVGDEYMKSESVKRLIPDML